MNLRNSCEFYMIMAVSLDWKPNKLASEMMAKGLRLYADQFPNQPVPFMKLLEYACQKSIVVKAYVNWDDFSKRSIEKNSKIRGIKDILRRKESIAVLNQKPLKIAWISTRANKGLTGSITPATS